MQDQGMTKISLEEKNIGHAMVGQIDALKWVYTQLNIASSFNADAPDPFAVGTLTGFD